MVCRGATQERIGTSADTNSAATPKKNRPQHHHNLGLFKTTNPFNIILDEKDMPQTQSQQCFFRCSMPILLIERTALLMCLLSVTVLVINSMSFPITEESTQRQLSSVIMASSSFSKTENDRRHPNTQHIRNNNEVNSILHQTPRVVHIDPDEFYTVQYRSSQVQAYQEKSNRQIHVPKRGQRAKRNLKNSERYEKWQRDPLREGDCEPMQPWQETSFPSCNKIHETDMLSQIQVWTDGGYNTIYKMTDMDGSTHIVKILKYKRDYTDRNFDRVRRDSLIMERATASDYVVDTYSYCGFSQIVEYGQGADLFSWIVSAYDHISQQQKLQIATQVAQALADVHNLQGNGISSMTHGDLASKQYVLVDGRFKLSDFNRGRFLRWNNKIQEPCPYTIGSNGGKFRSPEEHQYIPQTAAIDVWALGSIFVEIVTGAEAWDDYSQNAAQKAIVNGELPPFHKAIKNPPDPINQVLVKAIEMCYVYDPKKRPKAGDVVEYLKTESKRLGVEWNQPFMAI